MLGKPRPLPWTAKVDLAKSLSTKICRHRASCSQLGAINGYHWGYSGGGCICLCLH